jgi:Kef-type K+ transport system membrane component KefB
MRAKLIFYLVVVAGFTVLLWLIFRQGVLLETGKAIVAPPASGAGASLWGQLWAELQHNLHHPVALLVLQIVVIVFFARLMGILATRLGQPTVIGEILAGIILGPSLLGMFQPEAAQFLFPPDSLGNLQALSQLGLILFMFIIGMELDVTLLRRQAQAAVIISHASILFPYFLGVLLAYYLYRDYAPANISFLAFGLFMGIAMSITAFPVLARIVQERGMTKSAIGAMVITCAAADDVTAWCLLAAVIAIVKAGTATNALFVIGLSAAYVSFMIYVARPFLVKLADVYASKESFNKTVIAFIFLLLLTSAFLAEVIGIHALFGAFLAGAIIPPNLRFKEILAEKIEDVSMVLLLPLFFVFTGLRTQIGLLNTGQLWLVCGLIAVVAVVGKFVGSAVAARIVGQTWKDSLVIGALMNTRGLMELVVLNIGFDLGVLSPEIFAMMVLMAIGTTMMTGPALNAIAYLADRFAPGPLAAGPQGPLATFKVLISFGQPKMGSLLLSLAAQLGIGANKHFSVTALHVTPNSQVNPFDAQLFEQESFEPVQETADELGMALATKYRASDDVLWEVKDTIAQGGFDLLLVGGAKSLFSASETGGLVQSFLREVPSDVGVFIDKEFEVLGKLLLLLLHEQDLFLLKYASRFLENANLHLTVVDPEGWIEKKAEGLELANFFTSNLVNIRAKADLSAVRPDVHDLLLVSLGGWQQLSSTDEAWLAEAPSVLIIRQLASKPAR